MLVANRNDASKFPNRLVATQRMLHTDIKILNNVVGSPTDRIQINRDRFKNYYISILDRNYNVVGYWFSHLDSPHASLE